MVVPLVSKMLWPLQGEMVEDFQSVKSSGMGHFLHWGVEYLPQKWETGELHAVVLQRQTHHWYLAEEN